MKESKSKVQIIREYGFVLFAIVIIVAALFISVVRIASPLANNYRADVQEVLSRLIGHPFKLSAVRLEWQGIRPSIRMLNVNVYHEKIAPTKWLHADEIQVTLKPFSSLIAGKLELGDLKIIGTQVALLKLSDTQWVLNGSALDPIDHTQVNTDRVLKWISTRENISFSRSDFTLTDSSRLRVPVHLHNANMLLQNREDAYRVRGGFQLVDQGRKRVAFAADIRGDIARPEKLKCKYFIRGQTQLGDWVNNLTGRVANVIGGSVDFSIWSSGRCGNIDKISGEVDVKDVVWRWAKAQATDQASRPDIRYVRKLNSKFHVLREKLNWHALIEDLHFTREKQTWDSRYLQLAMLREEGNPQITVESKMSYLKLDDMIKLGIFEQFLPTAQSKPINRLAPSGVLKNLEFYYKGEAENAKSSDSRKLYFRAQGEELAVKASTELPGFNRISGSVVLNQDAGYLQVHSEDVRFFYPKLLDRSISLNKMTGKLYWHATEHGVRFAGREFLLNNPDIHAQSAFDLIPDPAARSPKLNLFVDYERVNLANAHHYFPSKIMAEKLLGYLNHAIIAGDVPKGRLLLSGALADFPFEHGEGIFDVRFRTNAMQFAYAKNWPVAENVMADVHFKNRTLAIQVIDGSIMGADLLPTNIEIDRLSKFGNLHFGLAAKGAPGNLLKVLSNSPAGDNYQALIGEMQTKGHALLSLRVKFPLKDAKQFKMDGDVKIDQGSLLMPNRNTKLEQIHGTIRFSKDGGIYQFDADEIAALYHGSPAKIDVTTDIISQSDWQTRIDLRTHMDVSAVFGEKGSVFDQVASGASDWLLGLSMINTGPNHEKRTKFSLSSDLQGVKVRLPGIFKKPSTTKLPFELDVDISKKETREVYLNYGSNLQARLKMNSQPDGSYLAERGEIKVGGGEPTIPETKAVRIVGQLKSIKFTDWLPDAAIGDGNKPAATGHKKLLDSVSSLQLKIDKLDMFDYKFSNVVLQSDKNDAVWTHKVNGTEVRGKLRVPQTFSQDSVIFGNFDYLILQKPSNRVRHVAVSPSQFPQLNINCGAFVFDGIKFGELKLIARRMETGIHFEQLDMQSPNVQVSSTGFWLLEGENQVSRFHIDASSANLGQAMKTLKYKEAVSGGTMSASLNANWDGAPSDFEFKKLNGTLRLKIEDGNILDLDPGGGRVLGLFSLQHLPRRLALDFRDFSAKGLGFDTIEGQFSIANGNAYTNDLVMDGPSSRIDISGRIGLADQDYDQLVTVTPRLSSTIPIIGGLLEFRPELAIGLWVADKIFGNRVDKMSRLNYSITGSWNNPNVVPVEISLEPEINDPFEINSF